MNRPAQTRPLQPLASRLGVAAVLSLAAATSGCANETDDDVAPIGRAEARLDDPSLISCRYAHPSVPAGNVLVTRVPTGPDTPDRIVAERDISCSVMGISGLDERTGELLEVVAGARLFEAAGGPSTPMTCGLCQELIGEQEDELDPSDLRSQRTTSFPTVVTYPGVVESIGVLYGTPLYQTWPGWHVFSNPPWGSQLSSYCLHPPNPGYTWGMLTNSRGWEITPGPRTGTVEYGNRAYQMYDPGWNMIRAASVDITGSGAPQLVPVPRTDTCAEPPRRMTGG